MFSYIGGKYRQAKWISKEFPKPIKRYAEVFGGAMWVYINGNILADEVYYNDYNRQMVNLFACCAQYETFLPYVNGVQAQNESKFYEFRADVLEANRNGIKMPDFDLAVKYVYLITQCFSGIVSENVKYVDLKGKYNSKYNSFSKRLNNPKIQTLLRKLQTHNQSYEDFISEVDGEDTYLYVDPPYYGTENLYAFHNFTTQDHNLLADILNNIKSKWVLSYYDFPEMHEWYPEGKYRWERKEYKKASMASKKKKQSIGEEIIIIKE